MAYTRPTKENPPPVVEPKSNAELQYRILHGLCVSCARPALEHCLTDAGRAEVRISGICEECFDWLFDETIEGSPMNQASADWDLYDDKGIAPSGDQNDQQD